MQKSNHHAHIQQFHRINECSDSLPLLRLSCFHDSLLQFQQKIFLLHNLYQHKNLCNKEDIIFMIHVVQIQQLRKLCHKFFPFQQHQKNFHQQFFSSVKVHHSGYVNNVGYTQPFKTLASLKLSVAKALVTDLN